MHNFGKRLRAERERLGMNRNELSKELKIAYTTLMDTENGKSNPSERTIRRVVEKFGWNDGIYADYYYGISDVDARRIVRQVKNKMEELGATQKDVAQVLRIGMDTYRAWMRNITPRIKREFTKFIEMDEEAYKARMKERDDQRMFEIDTDLIDDKANKMDGKQLKQLRIQHNFTQPKLANKIGVNYTAIGKWERGTQPIPPMRIRQLYKLFKLNYYEPKRVLKTQAQREKERLARVAVMHRMDRKVDNWKNLDDNDPDMVELRKLMGNK